MEKKSNLHINCHDLPILVFSLFTDARNLPSQFTIIYYTFMSEIKNVI